MTIPHKERVAARCARLTTLAERVGAVNTFWVEDGSLVGDNTDVGGFLEMLTATAPDAIVRGPLPCSVPVAPPPRCWSRSEKLGSRTFACMRRSSSRARSLSARFPTARAASTVEDAVRGAALVVNATPLGLDGQSIPIDVALLDHDAALLDLVVRRDETPVVRAARARGHRAADGLDMLLGQGALAFERWFGIAPDRAVMRASVARENV